MPKLLAAASGLVFGGGARSILRRVPATVNFPALRGGGYEPTSFNTEGTEGTEGHREQGERQCSSRTSVTSAFLRGLCVIALAASRRYLTICSFGRPFGGGAGESLDASD